MTRTFYQVVYAMGESLVSRPVTDRFGSLEDAQRAADAYGGIRIEYVTEHRETVWRDD